MRLNGDFSENLGVDVHLDSVIDSFDLELEMRLSRNYRQTLFH